jgi:putative ABC transport system permease protein
MRVTWREPLPVSLTAVNIPALAAVLAALLLARLLPVMRSLRTSVVAHERRRARAPDKPFWQRFYLDFLLLVPVVYAYRQLSLTGTLIPQSEAAGRVTIQDPLLFLVPALFTVTTSLLLIRFFPLLMRIGDALSVLGRRATLYLAFRQLSRQSQQYTSALLLVITSLSLGGFMASMAVSLDEWLLDQIYYEIGSDVLIRQMLNPEYAENGQIPPEGAWQLPVESYLDLPGVTDAARVGMYDARIQRGRERTTKCTFIGIDRLDLPGLLFFRPDFSQDTLGGLMNQLAIRQDGILVSERLMQDLQLQIGDQIPMRVVLVDVLLSEVATSTDFTVVGTFRYFPTVYEQTEGQSTVIGNLEYLFERVGGAELHHIWLKIEPDADKAVLRHEVEEMGVFIKSWKETRERIAEEQAKAERVGIFGTLSVGFLSAAVFSGVGLLIYNYASLQERLFRFTILRAVGLSLLQVVAQVTIEYTILMAYSVAGGAAIGAWASSLFIPFFQAADKNILRPPSMIPYIAWKDIGQISGAFILVLVIAQGVVVTAALSRGVFQALRMGDRE